MNKVEQIEDQVKDLSSDELKAFRAWFAQFDAELWDEQIAADSNNGKLATLAEPALADHEAGRSKLL